MTPLFPNQPEGALYLTEGGAETEIMYKFGFELPHFAMFPLLDNPAAVDALTGMYQRYLDTAARHGFGALVSGLDYRASPDWGELLGYSPQGLADMQHRCIGFLRDVAKPYQSQLPDIRIAGVVGPRGDAYALNRSITEAEAEDYHAIQMATLKAAGVDMVWGATFNNVPEAVGVARAAAREGLPLCLSFTLDSRHRLNSGPSLKDAIESVDRSTGVARPGCYGINCSHPVEFEPALEPGDWIQRIRSLRPNAAKMDKISLCKLGHLEEGDPVELGQLMGSLARRYPHIDMWGGCCGTWETHLEEIARNVAGAKSSNA
ncbi:homocysteine S-methyltransferase family protein [Marinobacter zhejiangensis]|uniref:Homocysteine S-methyltransferase n=1 Tax=Marinobacter zhejiangensis TaxID=488535 RepID=A0A1I4T076_9GAMM|nr:homocysteine S-methyltransferase family protein [Marinobacter zhejiangensis]SFM70132.1 homocysteine S-methyltransferase [Marinobacter zhejiangensis]